MVAADQAAASDTIDLTFRPVRRSTSVVQPIGLGAVAWADGDRPPILLDAASRTLLSIFDGASTLQEIVDDLEAELPDADPEIDLALGVLVTTQRLGLEGFLEGVAPVPSMNRPSAVFKMLTDWRDPGVLDEEVSGSADRTLRIADADLFAVDLPACPVRISSTRPELRALLDRVAPERVVAPDGGLFLSLVEGDEQRVGRPFFTLYGPHLSRLVVSPDLDEVVTRALRHLALPLWVHEEPELWWHHFRTLIDPEGDAVLLSAARLGQQVGLLRALERAGFTVVDSVLTPIDPTTLEVVLLPARFDPDRGEISRDEAGPAARARISTILFSHTDEDATSLDPEVVTRALARTTERTATVDRSRLLAGMAELASSARCTWLGQATPREVAEELSRRG
jgi:hypothetical protein